MEKHGSNFQSSTHVYLSVKLCIWNRKYRNRLSIPPTLNNHIIRLRCHNKLKNAKWRIFSLPNLRTHCVLKLSKIIQSLTNKKLTLLLMCWGHFEVVYGAFTLTKSTNIPYFFEKLYSICYFFLWWLGWESCLGTNEGQIFSGKIAEKGFFKKCPSGQRSCLGATFVRVCLD